MKTPIVKAMETADVIVINSPTYCLNMSGQLKTFFDHMCYRFMNHRPHPAMKDKIGIAISTTAGAGAKKTTGQIAKQMQKGMGYSPADMAWWKEQGWL